MIRASSNCSDGYAQLMILAAQRTGNISVLHPGLQKIENKFLKQNNLVGSSNSKSFEEFEQELRVVFRQLLMIKFHAQYSPLKSDIAQMILVLDTLICWAGFLTQNTSYLVAYFYIHNYLDLDMSFLNKILSQRENAEVIQLLLAQLRNYKIHLDLENAPDGEKRAAEQFMRGVETFDPGAVYNFIGGIARGRGFRMDFLAYSLINSFFSLDPKGAANWLENSTAISAFWVIRNLFPESLFPLLNALNKPSLWLRMEIIRKATQLKGLDHTAQSIIVNCIVELYHLNTTLWKYLIRIHGQNPIPIEIVALSMAKLNRKSHIYFLESNGMGIFDHSKDKLERFFRVFILVNRTLAIKFGALAFRRYSALLNNKKEIPHLISIVVSDYAYVIEEFLVVKFRKYQDFESGLSSALDALSSCHQNWHVDVSAYQTDFLRKLSWIFFLGRVATVRGYQFPPSHPFTERLLTELGDDRVSYRFLVTRAPELFDEILRSFGILLRP